MARGKGGMSRNVRMTGFDCCPVWLEKGRHVGWQPGTARGGVVGLEVSKLKNKFSGGGKRLKATSRIGFQSLNIHMWQFGNDDSILRHLTCLFPSRNGRFICSSIFPGRGSRPFIRVSRSSLGPYKNEELIPGGTIFT